MTWLACGEKFFPDDKRSPELVREVDTDQILVCPGSEPGEGYSIQGRPRPAMQTQQQVEAL